MTISEAKHVAANATHSNGWKAVVVEMRRNNRPLVDAFNVQFRKPGTEGEVFVDGKFSFVPVV